MKSEICPALVAGLILVNAFRSNVSFLIITLSPIFYLGTFCRSHLKGPSTKPTNHDLSFFRKKKKKLKSACKKGEKKF